jgi:hypothetical protein
MSPSSFQKKHSAIEYGPNGYAKRCSRGVELNAVCLSRSMNVAILIEAGAQEAVILSVLHLLFT